MTAVIIVHLDDF